MACNIEFRIRNVHCSFLELTVNNAISKLNFWLNRLSLPPSWRVRSSTRLSLGVRELFSSGMVLREGSSLLGWCLGCFACHWRSGPVSDAPELLVILCLRGEVRDPGCPFPSDAPSACSWDTRLGVYTGACSRIHILVGGWIGADGLRSLG